MSVYPWSIAEDVAAVMAHLVKMTEVAIQANCRIEIEQDTISPWIRISYHGADAQSCHLRMPYLLLSDLLFRENRDLMTFVAWLDRFVAGTLAE